MHRTINLLGYLIRWGLLFPMLIVAFVISEIIIVIQIMLDPEFPDNWLLDSLAVFRVPRSEKP